MTTAQEALARKEALFGERPCCDVPYREPNPECDWHRYRSLMVTLADLGLPEEVCAQALECETQAQIHALVFIRKSLIATAQEETAKGYDPLEVMAKLVDSLNTLIADLGK